MKIKSILTTGALALASVAPVLAEGESGGSSGMDVTQATGAITTIQNGLMQILTPLGAAVVSIFVAGVALWAIPRIGGALKSAFSSGKGR